MRQLTFFLCSLILLAGTVAGGWYHGQASRRWGEQPDERVAADRLNTPLPQSFGSWKYKNEHKFAEDVKEMLQCRAYINHVYENEQTGDVVTVAVIVGPHGPVAVHTPEICYSSKDYSIAAGREKKPIQTKDGREHSLWQLGLEPREPGQLPLTVLYGWSTGTTWEAAEHPRFSYGGTSHLYKVQAAVISPAKKADYDPAEDFLTSFLSELETKLVEGDHRPKN
jgi:hypothetical protein